LDASQSSEAQISVKGALNDQERAAINALAQQVSGVAKDFFSGNLDGALQSASQIDISGQAQTLSAYAFSLQSVETRTAAAIYDNVAQSTAPANVAPAVPPAASSQAPAPTPGKDLLKSLMAMLERFTSGASEAASSGGQATAAAPTASASLSVPQAA
jgi:hypothetical protein